MIVSINQPAYLPWLGYFDRIASSDVHVVLDHVQYKKNSMINRNKIRTATGWSWVTVPVLFKGKFNDQPISTVEVNAQAPGIRKHWRSIEQNYRRSTYFGDYAPRFAPVFEKEWSQLCPLIYELNAIIMDLLGLERRLVFSSDLGITSGKSDLILDICEALGADTYISGPFGRDYLDLGAFSAKNIDVRFQDYDHPEYVQAYDGFEPNLSVIDLLFNCGPESLPILWRGKKVLSDV